MAAKKKNVTKIESLTLEIQKAKAKIEKFEEQKTENKALAIILIDEDAHSKAIKKVIEKVEEVTSKISKKEKSLEKAEEKLSKLILANVEPALDIIATEPEVEVEIIVEEEAAPIAKPTRATRTPRTKAALTENKAAAKPRAPRKPRATPTKAPATPSTESKTAAPKAPAKPRAPRKPRTTAAKAPVTPTEKPDTEV